MQFKFWRKLVRNSWNSFETKKREKKGLLCYMATSNSPDSEKSVEIAETPEKYQSKDPMMTGKSKFYVISGHSRTGYKGWVTGTYKNISQQPKKKIK